jgi:hypothetical protein
METTTWLSFIDFYTMQNPYESVSVLIYVEHKEKKAWSLNSGEAFWKSLGQYLRGLSWSMMNPKQI